MNNNKIKITLFLAIATIVLIIGSLIAASSKHFQILNPSISSNPFDQIFEQEIIPKISRMRNNFSLYKANSLIPEAHAAEFGSVHALLAADLETGEILFDQNINKVLPIASLTKIMTSVVALDLAKSEDKFQISEHASRQIPTRIGVVAGQKMTLNELLNSLLLTSANDSATVIQEGIDSMYEAPVFIKAMNAKAEFLGLKNTSFANPQGFDDPSNYSTAEDLAVLVHYAYTNYPLIKEIVRKDYEFLPENSQHKQFDLNNWNGLIGVYPGAKGMKIGSTEQAKKTTAVVATRSGHDMLAIVLGAPGLFERDGYAARLLDIGYEKEFGFAPINITKDQLQAKYNSWKYY